MNENNLIEILSTNDKGEIAIIKSLLESERIPYLIQGEQFNAMRAPIPVRILIPESMIDKAKDVLTNFL